MAMPESQPDAPLGPEELEALGEEIATFAARADAANHAMMARLRQFDAQEGWALQGALSCAHWLAWRTSMSLTTARERVRVARALGNLPKVDEALASGTMSYSKARAISRVAKPENEEDYVDIAEHATAAQMDKLCRAQTRIQKTAEPSDSEPLSARRFVRRWDTSEGMVRIEVQLPAEEAELVWTAITATTDLSQPDSSAEASASDSSAEASQPDSSAKASNSDRPGDIENRRADAVVAIAEASLRRGVLAEGSSFELLLITQPDQLRRDAEEGLGHGGQLMDGTAVPVAAARAIACDAHKVDVSIDARGNPLDVGRKSRVVGPALRRALRVRDRGCAYPGCTNHRHVDAHHIEHWVDGGETSLSNMALLCRRHHRMIHNGLLEVELVDDRPVFRRANSPVVRVPDLSHTGRDLQDLDAYIEECRGGLESLGLEPKWNGDLLDLDEALDALQPKPERPPRNAHHTRREDVHERPAPAE